MKKATRILTLVLAVVMCAGAFASFSAFADGEPAVEFIYRENYDNMLIDVPEKAECAGIWPGEGFAKNAKLENGYLNCVFNDTDKVNAFVDFQLWTDSDIKAIKEDFTLSLNFKLLGEWTNSLSNFWVFRYYAGYDADNRETMNAHSFFTIANGKFTMITDNGTVSSDADLFSDYVTVDWAFDMNDGKFTSLTCYVNGQLLGTKSLSSDKLNGIDQFRMFYTATPGQGVSINSSAFAKGTQSLYGVTIPDSPVVRPPQSIPAIPTVADEDKVDMKYHYREDFEDIDEVNTSNAQGDVRAANGFWLNTGGEQKYTLTDEGTLNWGGAEFLDFHFYQLNKYRVKEDFVLSVKIKPLAQGLDGHFVSQVRRAADGEFSKPYGMITFKKGCVMIGDANYGLLPVNEWTYLEVIFDYDEDESIFTHFKLMINGTVVATEELDPDAVLTQIKQFRMFRVMTNMNFEVDDICVVSGTTSMLYAKPYSEDEELPEDPVDGEENEDNGENTEDTEKKPAKDKAPAKDASTESSTPDTAPAVEKKGCGSSVTVGAVALISAVSIGGIALIRKKED